MTTHHDLLVVFVRVTDSETEDVNSRQHSPLSRNLGELRCWHHAFCTLGDGRLGQRIGASIDCETS